MLIESSGSTGSREGCGLTAELPLHTARVCAIRLPVLCSLLSIIIFIFILFNVENCGGFLSHHCIRDTAHPMFPLLANVSEAIRMFLKKDCKCQLPFLISGEPVVFSMFLHVDLFLLFCKRAFAAVLCTKPSALQLLEGKEYESSSWSQAVQEQCCRPASLSATSCSQPRAQCSGVLIHWELAAAPKAMSNTWGQLALKLFCVSSLWDFCYQWLSELSPQQSLQSLKLAETVFTAVAHILPLDLSTAAILSSSAGISSQKGFAVD
ncbi:hypothetical protein EK904_006651 [Melospiza melodia maxima]|nr:hypothetical protein EK904_006651 [Melospiza melodia maxima]